MVGEIGADLVGIDILERDGARAVDELTLELPAGYDPDDLVFALSQIAGVEVEDLRHLVSRPTSAGCDPLDVAVSLVESTGADELATALISGVERGSQLRMVHDVRKALERRQGTGKDW